MDRAWRYKLATLTPPSRVSGLVSKDNLARIINL